MNFRNSMNSDHSHSPFVCEFASLSFDPLAYALSHVANFPSPRRPVVLTRTLLIWNFKRKGERYLKLPILYLHIVCPIAYPLENDWYIICSSPYLCSTFKVERYLKLPILHPYSLPSLSPNRCSREFGHLCSTSKVESIISHLNISPRPSLSSLHII